MCSFVSARHLRVGQPYAPPGPWLLRLPSPPPAVSFATCMYSAPPAQAWLHPQCAPQRPSPWLPGPSGGHHPGPVRCKQEVEHRLLSLARRYDRCCLGCQLVHPGRSRCCNLVCCWPTCNLLLCILHPSFNSQLLAPVAALYADGSPKPAAAPAKALMFSPVPAAALPGCPATAGPLACCACVDCFASTQSSLLHPPCILHASQTPAMYCPCPCCCPCPCLCPCHCHSLLPSAPAAASESSSNFPQETPTASTSLADGLCSFRVSTRAEPIPPDAPNTTTTPVCIARDSHRCPL
jgi:hypothetical protein